MNCQRDLPGKSSTWTLMIGKGENRTVVALHISLESEDQETWREEKK
jgi:hypothetical protein